MAQILHDNTAIKSGQQRSGKNARVLIGAGNLPLRHAQWTVNERGEDLDTTNFESYVAADDATYEEGILGVQGCEWSTRGDWDNSRNTFNADPPGLYPRDDLSALQFYTNYSTDSVSWNFPYARVRSASNSAEIRGKVSFEASGRNQGPYARPGV